MEISSYFIRLEQSSSNWDGEWIPLFRKYDLPTGVSARETLKTDWSHEHVARFRDEDIVEK